MTWIGADVSKGFIDVLCVSGTGQSGALHRFDDTPSGHHAWWAYLDQCLTCFGRVYVGLESTGGLERNWMRSFSQWSKDHSSSIAKCRLVDPRAVHRLAGSLPDRCKTDPSSARVIANYLRLTEGLVSTQAAPPEERAFFRSLTGLQSMSAKLINQIKSLLPEVHPSLVARTHANGLPAWVLAVLKKYPTNARLSKAHVSTLAKIPHVTPERARKLVAQAKDVPAALEGAMAEAHMLGIIDAYEHQQLLVDKQWLILRKRFEGNEDYQRLQTIPGIGAKTACAWMSELPLVEHFSSAHSLVGFIGLDPVFEQSGDGVVQKGISHRGSSELRKLLYMAAQSGITCNPSLRRFYHRLRSNGKGHNKALVACMGKLVRIAYACLVSKEDFDPERVKRDQTETKTDQRGHAEPLGRSKPQLEAGQTECSPISPKERKRRQQKAAAGCSTRSLSQKTSSPAATCGNDPTERRSGHRKLGLKCTG